ncbi:MAG: cadmium-translocating P-type ATPase [Ruminococcaceae bacterium]|nr:cadmium-translocating P-type ATPase [Oscillospiraceae bacterium]
MSEHEHKHEHEEKCSCGCCGHEHEHHHEHEHEHQHAHGEKCSCGHDHGDECDCSCGCGHSHGEEEEGGSRLKSILLYTLGSIPVIVGFLPIEPFWIPIAASFLGYILFGVSVYAGMIKGFLKKKIFTEFTLMCAATVGAFCIGEYADAAAVMYLYSLGEMISDRAYSRSKKNVSELIELTPERVTVVRDDELANESPEHIEVGEQILVRAGERIALDGVVVSGSGNADTSSVTGESKPLELYCGVSCPSGSILLDGSVTLRVEKRYENSVVAELSRAVKEAQKRKSESEKKIARFARIFTPTAFAICAAIILGGGLVTHEWEQWVRAGLTVLVISCPCSLVLSVPLAYFAGIGYAAKKGIVFRGGEIMDSVCRIEAIAFDKTGTLTESGLSYDGAELYCDISDEEFSGLAKAVLSHSPHAAAIAFCSASDERFDPYEIKDIEIVGGRGVVCAVNGKRALFGNAALLRENGIDAEDSKTTAIFGALDGKLLGKLNFSSHLKNGVKSSVEELSSLGVTSVCVLSGDGEESVRSACEKAGINEFYPKLTPKEKLDKFEEMYARQKSISRKSTVAFCGDGLNDSAVIARADVGIAMGLCGSDLTVTSADVVIADDDIASVSRAIRIAKRTERVANVSIALSLGIKIAVVLIGVAFAVWGAGELPLSAAVVADVGAAVVSVLNSARAGRIHDKPKFI